MNHKTKAAILKAKLSIEEAVRLLGLSLDDARDKSKLKTAHRKAALAHHPDRGGSAETMKLVNEAYDLLEKQVYRSPSGRSKEEDQAEYAAKVNDALKIVQASLSKAFDPAAFTKHFEKVTGKPFTEETKQTVSKDFYGNPQYVRSSTEWRSEDGKTIFSLFLSVSLADVVRVRMLGGGDDGNMAFTVSMMQEILHDKRKSKFKPRDWSTSSKARTLMDPEDLFPTAKIKKMMSGKEKTRKFSKRDMELGIEKLLGGRLETGGSGQLWAFIPVGEPQPQQRFPGAVSRPDEDRFIVRMYRSVMTWRRESLATWNGMDVQGPYVPKKGRETFNFNASSAQEGEALLDALVEAQKKTKGMSDGAQIAKVFHQAFVKAKEGPKEVPAPVDFGGVQAALEAAMQALGKAD